MSEVTTGAPLHVSRFMTRAIRDGADGPVAAATTTANVFGRELGELNHKQRIAEMRGEVVTRAAVELEFEMRGRIMAARSASHDFASQAPASTPSETFERQAVASQAEPTAPQEPATAPAAPPSAGNGRDLQALTALMADKARRLNDSLRPLTAQAPQAPRAETPEAKPSVDVTA